MTPDTASTSSLPEPKVFISYRREETSAYAGRLYDSMAAEFGDANVFMDVDLAPGIDFVERITNAVSACHVLIVVMGPRWATLTDEDGGVRIADAEDFVRLEVGTALRRADVTVIPVLVSGARMPDGDDLPSDLRPLARRNALELSDGRWRDDVRRLLSRLEELLAGTTAVHETVAAHHNGHAAAEAPAEPAAPVSAVRIVAEGVLVAAVIGLVAGGLANALPDKLSDADQVLKRMATWMPVALGIAIWLTVRFGQRSILRNVLLALGIGAVASALAGVISYYPEQKPSDLAVTVPAYAVLGAGMGGLMGLLWVPRRPGTGLAAGIAGGVIVGLVVPVGSDVPTLLVAIRAVIIISATLGALLWADAQARGSPRRSP